MTLFDRVLIGSLLGFFIIGGVFLFLSLATVQRTVEARGSLRPPAFVIENAVEINGVLVVNPFSSVVCVDGVVSWPAEVRPARSGVTTIWRWIRRENPDGVVITMKTLPTETLPVEAGVPMRFTAMADTSGLPRGDYFVLTAGQDQFSDPVFYRVPFRIQSCR